MIKKYRKLLAHKPQGPVEQTDYGTARYRKPYRKDEFTGTKGSPADAIILDIDGTLMTYGSGAQKHVLDWCAGYAKKGVVFIVITARDHDYMFTSSFNWLLHNFPHPFIGPFCRAVDDPRYASEFKRELAQSFEDMGLFHIIGAADDNEFVIKMWKHWGEVHDGKFDLLECVQSYSSWRRDLPAVQSASTHTFLPPAGDSWASYLDKREESGAYDDQPEVQSARWAVYDKIDRAFDYRYLPEELDELDFDQLEQVLVMTQQEADAFIDSIVLAQTDGQGVIDRLDERIDLESQAYSDFPDVSVEEIQSMDIEVLRALCLEGVKDVG